MLRGRLSSWLSPHLPQPWLAADCALTGGSALGRSHAVGAAESGLCVGGRGARAGTSRGGGDGSLVHSSEGARPPYGLELVLNPPLPARCAHSQTPLLVRCLVTGARTRVLNAADGVYSTVREAGVAAAATAAAAAASLRALQGLGCNGRCVTVRSARGRAESGERAHGGRVLRVCNGSCQTGEEQKLVKRATETVFLTMC